MKIQKLECPNCHASLDNDYGNAGVFFCKYCGQKMIVEEIQNAEYDLKIRKLELERETAKLESERKKQTIEYAINKEEKKHELIKYTFCVCLVVLMFSIAFIPLILYVSPHKKLVRKLNKIETEVQEAILEEDYDLAILKANQLRLDDAYSSTEEEVWEEKRKEYIQIINNKKDKK